MSTTSIIWLVGEYARSVLRSLISKLRGLTCTMDAGVLQTTACVIYLQVPMWRLLGLYPLITYDEISGVDQWNGLYQLDGGMNTSLWSRV